jgi:hypothetical protein
MKNYLRTFFKWGRYFYLWQSTFADGIIAATVIDAQVNYELPKLKSTNRSFKYW